MRILITGGAGFIGSLLVRQLLDVGAEAVLIYDNLHPQVHGPEARAPDFGNKVTFVHGDICDRETLHAAVKEFQPTAVAHLASETGTGQSHDEIVRYTDVNVSGTAQLLEALTAAQSKLEWFVLTSSRAVYGEGAYRRQDGSVTTAVARHATDLAQGRFGVYEEDGQKMAFLPTSSLLAPNPLSVYASTKLTQEYLLRNLYDFSDTRLLIYRFQNVYGAGQSLINPYTGVLSIFLSRLLEGQPIGIFEDGEISRDFVYVDDVVSAMMAGIMQDVRPERPLDIGSGIAARIYDVALKLSELVGANHDSLPITGAFRPGDIRHAVADISYAQKILGWKPEVDLNEGLSRLYEWGKDKKLPKT